jgi:hypothetical protein
MVGADGTDAVVVETVAPAEASAVVLEAAAAVTAVDFRKKAALVLAAVKVGLRVVVAAVALVKNAHLAVKEAKARVAKDLAAVVVVNGAPSAKVARVPGPSTARDRVGKVDARRGGMGKAVVAAKAAVVMASGHHFAGTASGEIVLLRSVRRCLWVGM